MLPKLKVMNKLRELRVNSGYTQQQVSEFLNCARSTYTYYETGKSSPDLPTLVKLSKIFNVSVAELLEEERNGSMVADSAKPVPQKKNASHIYDLSPEESMLIGYFRVLGPEERRELLRYAQNQNSQESEEK